MKFKLGQKIIDKLRNKKQNENKKLLENVLNCLQSILQINNKILERSNYVGGQRWEIELQERYKNKLYLDGFGYKVFSQNDEAGIINEIFTRIGTTNKKFIEFGVQDGIECNSHLLLDTGWSGLWIDGNKDDCNKIKTFFKTSLEDKKLAILNDFITKDNINELFAKAEFQGEIDFLSIDIDGNDWHVLEAILKRKQIIPRVICVEYNPLIPPASDPMDCSTDYVLPYKEDWIWPVDDSQGASLSAYYHLCKNYGYRLVGTCVNGVNAFFIQENLAQDKFISDKNYMYYLVLYQNFKVVDLKMHGYLGAGENMPEGYCYIPANALKHDFYMCAKQSLHLWNNKNLFVVIQIDRILARLFWIIGNALSDLTIQYHNLEERVRNLENKEIETKQKSKLYKFFHMYALRGKK